MAHQEQRTIESRGRLRHATESESNGKSDIWYITAITAGEGSSTTYTSEILQAGAAAFPKGTKLFFRHLGFWENEQRDPRDQFAYLVEDSWYDPNTDSIQGKAKVLKHWSEIVATLADEGQADLSISAVAAINEETGEIVGILPHLTNTIDLIGHPGRPGSRITQRAYESARNGASDLQRPDTTPVQEIRKVKMDEKALEAVVTRLLESKLAPVLTFVESTKAQKVEDAQAAVDEAALGSARKEAIEAYRAADALISAAELLDPQVADLRERAAAGEDITKAVESAKTLKDAAIAAVAENAKNKGQEFLTEGAGSDENWEVSL